MGPVEGVALRVGRRLGAPDGTKLGASEGNVEEDGVFDGTILGNLVGA